MMVVLCRWAEAGAFAGLVGELGERVWGAADEDKEGGMGKAERRAVVRVCFMAGNRLDKLVQIWAEEIHEEEEEQADGAEGGGDYGVRAKAVQTFVEKAIAFCTASGFLDPDLSTPSGTAEKQKEYVVGPLYECYVEYGEILAAQGMVPEELRYPERVPTGFGDVQWLRGSFTGSGSAGKVNGIAAGVSTGAKGGQGAYGGATHGRPHSFRISIPAASPSCNMRLLPTS